MRATKRISDPRPIYDEDYLDISKGKFSSFLVEYFQYNFQIKTDAKYVLMDL